MSALPASCTAAAFLGYVEALARSTLDGASGSDAALRQANGLLEKFDMYFRVYVGLHDSQEPWIKRTFWRLATRREYEIESTEALRSIGLETPEES